MWAYVRKDTKLSKTTGPLITGVVRLIKAHSFVLKFLPQCAGLGWPTRASLSRTRLVFMSEGGLICGLE